MVIGIDGNEANVERKVGISEYSYELLRQFAQNPVSGFTYQVSLKESPRSEMPIADTHWQYRVFGPRKIWTQFALPLRLYLSRKKPDIFFTPSHYAPRFSPVPTVISIMDVAYLRYPEMFNEADLYQLKNWTAYSVKQAKRVITISNSSKNDIMKQYHVPGKKVSVIYPGIKPLTDLTPHVYGMKELISRFGISENYILFVGTLQPRKNIERLIEAFAITRKSDSAMKKDIQLVIVGKKGWLYEPILAAPEKHGVSEQVKFLDFVSDADLALLYQHAICYVLPSLYEGFGLPVLEAMKYKCPVITSNISSLPEAGGDAALYVDPKDPKDIAEKIERVVGDEKLRKKLIEKGQEQIKKFSWEKAAHETLAVLEEVAKEEKNG